MYISNPRFQKQSVLHAVSSSPSGGAEGGKTIATVGDDSTTTPSAAEADSAETPNVDNSELCTAEAVVAAGTAIVAVMSTLAATTWMETSHPSTPAALATFCRKLELSE
eukprot:scaffold70212_cov72-Phaeocystis_antarctica.AAC.1